MEQDSSFISFQLDLDRSDNNSLTLSPRLKRKRLNPLAEVSNHGREKTFVRDSLNSLVKKGTFDEIVGGKKVRLAAKENLFDCDQLFDIELPDRKEVEALFNPPKNRRRKRQQPDSPLRYTPRPKSGTEKPFEYNVKKLKKNGTDLFGKNKHCINNR